MKKDNKNASTPNKGKCILSIDVDCYKRFKCNDYQKKGCKLFEISNMKST